MSEFEIAVLDQLKALTVAIGRLDARIGSLEHRMDRLEHRMDSIEEEMRDTKKKVNSFPDMYFLQAAAKVQIEYIKSSKIWQLNQDAKMGEIFHSMATSPEILVIRKNMDEIHSEMTNNDVRLRSIEELGIQLPV